jgi:biotin carboxylase
VSAPRGARAVLVVGASVFQCDVIAAAQRAGFTVHAVDGARDAPGLSRADHAHVLDIRDEAGVVALARGLGIAAVLSAGSDAALGAWCAVAEALGLPGPARTAVATASDKLASFRALRARGLATPETQRADLQLPGLAAQIAAGVGYPCVLKPARGAGGRGVTVVRGPEQLAAALARAEAAGRGSPVLVQAYLEGLSLGVEACFFEGELVRAFPLSDQYVDGFVSPVGHALPCALSAAELATVHHAVRELGRALGVRSGVVNFDTRLFAGQLHMLEANLRPGGSSITELLRMSLGVDVSLAALRCAFGEHPGDALTPRAHAEPAASRLVLVPRLDPVAHARPVCELVPGVVLAELTPPGARPADVNGTGVAGRCLVRGPSVPEAVARAERAAAELAASLSFEEPALG